jgi:hypothetical protein
MSWGTLQDCGTGPPNGEGGSVNVAHEKLLSSTKIIAFPTKINGSDWQVWERQKERLRQEFRRTRNERHFRAFVRHVASMEARAMAFGAPQPRAAFTKLNLKGKSKMKCNEVFPSQRPTRKEN